jgi:virginiamycin B lyase
MSILLVSVLAGAGPAGAAPPAPGQISSVQAGISLPQMITQGPDGALWYSNYRNSTIGRITPAGVDSTFAGPGINGPEGITTGPSVFLGPGPKPDVF